MSSTKDVSKIALTGAAVCGILALIYIYKKKSKAQDDALRPDKHVNEPRKRSTGEYKMDDHKSDSKPTSDQIKPDTSPSKPKSESKIPQKIPTSKPQTSASDFKQPAAVAKSVAVPDVGKAGGESIPEQTPKPVQINAELNQTAPDPTPKVETKPEKTKKQADQPTEVPVHSPLEQQNKPSQDSIVKPLSQSSLPTDLVEDSTVKSQASIILTPKPEAPNTDQKSTSSAPEQPEHLPPLQSTPQNIAASSSTQPQEESSGTNIKTEAVQNGTEPQEQSTVNVAQPKEQSVTNGTEAPETVSRPKKYDVESITKAIQAAKNTPANVDKETIDVLVSLLKQKDIPLLQASLDCIVRCGAFSQNQVLLRESGCIQELTLLLEVHAVAARTGVQESQTLLGSINNAIINLCMDIQNQARLEVCIPVLIDLITFEKSPEDVQLMSLKSLTNLSTTPSYHEQYISAIPRLFTMIDGRNSSVRLQAVKVLVNLSCNPEIIPDILESKSPVALLKCLEPQTDSILLLRIVTLLVNLVSCVKEGKMADDRLPSEINPPKPDSMYMTLFGANESVDLKVRIQGITRHSTDNVSKQAIRLFEYIK